MTCYRIPTGGADGSSTQDRALFVQPLHWPWIEDEHSVLTAVTGGHPGQDMYHCVVAELPVPQNHVRRPLEVASVRVARASLTRAGPVVVGLTRDDGERDEGVAVLQPHHG